MTELTPTVEDLLNETAVSNGWHDVAVEGGTIRISAEAARMVFEEAYDPSMPNWPAMITEEDLCAAMDA